MGTCVKKIPMYIVIAINLVMIVAMNFCAYTAYFPSQDYPEISYFGLLFPVFVVADLLFIPFWLIFKWKMTVLPVAGALLCAGAIRTYCPLNFPVEAPEGSLKVLSFNVMSFGANKDVPWEDNEVVKYVMDADADIVCLQEAIKPDIERGKTVFRAKYPYIVLKSTKENHLMCMSKFPMDSIGEINYPSATNRSMVVEVLVKGDTIVLVNNHLESYKLSPEDKDDYKSIIKNYDSPDANDSELKFHNLAKKLSHSDSIRGIQADSVAAFIERNKGRYIIACGDFNSASISYTHHRMTGDLNDAYTRSGNGPGVSYNRSGMYFRIDNIFVSPNISAYGAKVDNTFSLSDHYPITCSVKLEEK